MLAMAGNDIAEIRPWTALSTTTIQSSAVPVITSSAIAAWVSPEMTLETWMTSVRGNLSAITPPQSRNTHLRDRVGRQHLPQRGGRVGDLEHRERQRDGGHHVAERC